MSGSRRWPPVRNLRCQLLIWPKSRDWLVWWFCLMSVCNWSGPAVRGRQTANHTRYNLPEKVWALKRSRNCCLELSLGASCGASRPALSLILITIHEVNPQADLFPSNGQARMSILCLRLVGQDKDAICHHREQSTLDHPWLDSSVVQHLVYNQGGLGSIPSLAKYLGLTGMGT